MTKRIFLTEEHKKKISETLKGHIISEKTKKKLRKANLGKKHSEETKRKLSEKNKGRKPYQMTDEIREKIRKTNTGKKHSEKAKKKISKANKWKKKPPFSEEHIRKIVETRKKNGSYIAWNKGLGNKTPENKRIRMSIEFRLWREAVFARDNWTCQKTKIKGGKLHPHHIQNFAQITGLRFEIDNGITLSEKSHIEFHKIYGKRNNTKEQLENFLI